MDSPRSKVTQTLEVYFSHLEFCYAEVVFCFLFSQVFRFGEVNTQLSPLRLVNYTDLSSFCFSFINGTE